MWRLVITSLLFINLFHVLYSRPSSLLKYDQRQEGGFNLRADLENFVIILVPAERKLEAPPSSNVPNTLGLFDLFTKSHPFRQLQRKYGLMKKHQSTKPALVTNASSSEDVEAFIESKTAPYHVDISKSKANLAQLYPPIVESEENLLISPSLSLIRKGLSSTRQTKKLLSRASRFMQLSPAYLVSISPSIKEDIHLLNSEKK